jgi:nicotinamidase-related amidase
MTTLTDRPATALLVIDVQQGVVGGAYRRDEVVANIGDLVSRARAEGRPVVWVQHSSEGLMEGTDAWQYVPELVRSDAEPLVHKTHGDSFAGTELEEVLAAAGVGHLVVTGAESDACIRSTLHGAFVRGYDVTLVSDAHTAGDKSAWGAPPVDQVVAHTNLYWRYETAPDRTAAVVETRDVTFAG